MLYKSSLALSATFLLTACASAWINNPSPPTRGLINDLRLEGFQCDAKATSILCVQSVPLVKKQPSICSADKGCIKQPNKLIYNAYEVVQQADGIPSFTHQLIEEDEK